MSSSELEKLSPYAAKSLKERMITRILEREDVGYLRWTPKAIYDQVQMAYPDMYPENPSQGVLYEYHTPEFLEELAVYRTQRRMSQLPARMLADTIGRRIVDLTLPIIMDKLEEVARGEGLLDMREARMLLKDALNFTVANEEAMLGRGDPRSKEKADEQRTGLSMEEAVSLLARATGDRREVMAKVIAMELMAQAAKESGVVIDVEEAS